MYVTCPVHFKYFLYVTADIKQIMCCEATCKVVLLSVFAKTNFMESMTFLKDLVNRVYVSLLSHETII